MALRGKLILRNCGFYWCFSG